MMDEEDRLKGQYFVYVQYLRKPRRVKRSGIVSSKAALLRRDRPKESASAPRREEQNLLDLLHLHHRISGYTRVALGTISSTYLSPGYVLHGELERETGKSLELLKSSKQHDLFITKSLDVSAASKALRRYEDSNRYSYAVENAVFSGLVAGFDELLGNLLRTAIRQRPGILASSKRTIAYHDIVKASNFERLQNDVIIETVSDLVERGRLDQIEWLEGNLLDLELKAVMESYAVFIEAGERRNVFVHNDGFPSNNYYSRLTKALGTRPTAPADKRLEVEPEYLLSVSDALIEAYVIISQGVVRKLMKKPTEEEREAFDTLFNQAIYDQLDEGRYESAIRLSKALLGEKFKVSDLISKMSVVNKAIAERKLGKAEDANRTLDSSDWSSAKDEFRLCVAALRGDIDAVCDLIPRMQGSDLIDPTAYFEWPAFDFIRSEERFWEKLVEVYGEVIRLTGESSTNPTKQAGSAAALSSGE